MTKNEFLTELSNRLKILKKAEVDDIIAEYSQHIDMKIESGMSEEDAIHDFGEINELVEGILDAYSVDPGFQKVRFEDRVVDATKRLAEYINVFTESLLAKNKRQVTNIIVKAVIIFVVLCIAGALVGWISSLISSIFYMLPYIIYNPIRVVIRFVCNLAFLALVIYVVYVFINQYIITNEAREDAIRKKEERTAAEVRAKEKFKMEYTEPYTNDTASAESIAIDEMSDNEGPRPVEKERKHSGNAAISLFTICLKILAVLILIPVIFSTIGVVIGLCTTAVMLVSGYSVIGVTLILLGCALIGCSLTYGLISFLITRKQVKEA